MEQHIKETRQNQAEQQAGAYTQELEQEITQYRETETEMKQRTDLLALINGITREINATLELDEMLDRVAYLLREMFKYDHVALYLIDGDLAKLKAVAGLYEAQIPEEYSQSLDQGIIGQVVTYGDKMVINDVANEPDYLSLVPEQVDIQSEMCLPIKMSTTVLGVLDVQSPQLNAFGPNDIAAMETLTHQIAVAIEKAHLYETIQTEFAERKWAEAQLKNRAHQQAIVAELGLRALSGDELAVLIDEAVKFVAEGLEIEYCQILELLPDVDQLLLRAGVGWEEELIGETTISADTKHQSGYTLLSSEPVIVEELATEERFSGSPLLEEHEVVSGMSVIIDGRDWPFGVLGVHTTKKRTFTQDDINFLQAIANVLAQAIERKRAEEALRESEERYRNLVETLFETIAIYSEGRFVYVNSAGAKLYGASTADELIGRAVTDFIQPDHLEIIETHQRKSGRMPLIEDRLTRRDGSSVDVEIAGVPITYQGRPATQIVIRDITERKWAEVELKNRAQQQAVVAELGQRVLAGLNISTLINQAVQLVAEGLEIEYCQILELLPDVDQLLLRAGVGWEEELIGETTISADTKYQSGYTLLSSEPVIVEELAIEERFSSDPLLEEHEVVSGMSVIIDGRDWPFGVLGVHTTKKRTFTQDDINFLQAIANVLAQAIERKRAEEALRESEERYRNLVETLFETIAIYSEGRFVYVNSAGAKLYGASTADELIGRAVTDFIQPDHLEIIEAHQRVEQTDQSTLLEDRLTRRDGSSVDVEIAGVPITYQGRPATQIVIRDITERKRAEKALQENEEKYRTLIEKSSDAIFLLYGGRFEIINRKFEELFGITHEDIQSPDFVFTNIVAPKSRKLVMEGAARQITDPKLYPRYELTALDKDGNEIEIELTVSYPTYRQGLATQGIMRDITERKRIEDEKRNAYEQVQKYAEELAEKIEEVQRQREIATILAEVVASVSLTLSPGELLDHILFKLQQLISYDSAAIFLLKDEDHLVMEAARGFEDEIVNQEFAVKENTLYQLMRDQKSYILVEDTRTDDRYQFWYGADSVRSWIGAPLLIAQKMIGYLTVDRHLPNTFVSADADLAQAFAHQVAQTIHNAQLFTDLREAQSQLIQRERLAALGQMAATVAHEIRNPLMAIRMGIEYLVRDVPSDDPRQRGAALMQVNMGRIDRIVEDILYVSRAPRPNLALGSLYTVLQDELTHWEMNVADKNITIIADLEEGLPPILLDADQIGRSLSNLIGNGIDAVGPGGKLHLALYTDADHKDQVITITDNGPGIPPENQLKIFEPFFTTKSRGTGLGLAIVKQIINYHRGEIRVTSEVGQGTTFTINLPQVEKES